MNTVVKHNQGEQQEAGEDQGWREVREFGSDGYDDEESSLCQSRITFAAELKKCIR